MTAARQPQINEELLSAYLDDEVTDEERTVVEAAIAADPAVAWQVESLRQTIHLLQELPPLALPRAFTLEALLADAQSTEVLTAPHVETTKAGTTGAKASAPRHTTISTPPYSDQPNNWWRWLLQIWQGGNLQLRNAAAVAFTLLIVLLVSDRLVAPSQLRPLPTLPSSSAKLVTTTAGEATTSAAMVMTTAPVATSANLASTTAPPPPVADAPQANQATGTPVQSAKMTSDQDGATARQGTTGMLPAQPSGPPGEDIEDMTGANQRGANDQAVQAGSMSTLATDGGQLMATESSGPLLMTQATAPATGAPSASSQISTAVTQSPAPENTLAITAAITGTPTATVTATEVISAAEQTGMMSNHEATIAPPVASNDAQLLPTTAARQWLVWAKLVAGICTVVLGSLWWRSRGFAHA